MLEHNPKTEDPVNELVERYDRRFENLSQPKRARWATIRAELLNTKKSIETKKVVPDVTVDKPEQRMRQAIKKAEREAEHLLRSTSQDRYRYLVIGSLIGIGAGALLSLLLSIMQIDSSLIVWPIIGGVFGLVFGGLYYQRKAWNNSSK